MGFSRGNTTQRQQWINYELELYSLHLPVAKFYGLNDQVVGSEFDQQIIIHSYEKYYKESWD